MYVIARFFVIGFDCGSELFLTVILLNLIAILPKRTIQLQQVMTKQNTNWMHEVDCKNDAEPSCLPLNKNPIVHVRLPKYQKIIFPDVWKIYFQIDFPCQLQIFFTAERINILQIQYKFSFLYYSVTVRGLRVLEITNHTAAIKGLLWNSQRHRNQNGERMGGGYCLVCHLWLSMRGPLGLGRASRHDSIYPSSHSPARDLLIKLVRQLHSLFRHRSKNQSIHAGSILEVIECTLNTISRKELYAGGSSGLINTHITQQGRTLLYNSKC